jgi:hypothetical protein
VMDIHYKFDEKSTAQQLCQFLLMLWEHTKCDINSIKKCQIENIAEIFNDKIKELNFEEASCMLMYLVKLQLPIKNSINQKLIDKCLSFLGKILCVSIYNNLTFSF